MLDCINFGTTTGANINHLPETVVLNKLTINNTNITSNNNGNPVKFKSLIILAPVAVIKVDILVFLNTATNSVAKNTIGTSNVTS